MAVHCMGLSYKDPSTVRVTMQWEDYKKFKQEGGPSCEAVR